MTGSVSDIQGIAQTVHRFQIPLLVDEAHGAHFGIAEGFPQSAVRCGADLVIQSLHKTLPCLTQTAFCTAGGDLVDRQRLRRVSADLSDEQSLVCIFGGNRSMYRRDEKKREECFWHSEKTWSISAAAQKICARLSDSGRGTGRALRSVCF